MKAIPKNQFLVMVQNTFNTIVCEDEIQAMFEQFGDDWFFDRDINKFEKETDKSLYRAKEFNI